jgi:hypothetical protein
MKTNEKDRSSDEILRDLVENANTITALREKEQRLKAELSTVMLHVRQRSCDHDWYTGTEKSCCKKCGVTA